MGKEWPDDPTPAQLWGGYPAVVMTPEQFLTGLGFAELSFGDPLDFRCLEPVTVPFSEELDAYARSTRTSKTGIRATMGGAPFDFWIMVVNYAVPVAGNRTMSVQICGRRADGQHGMSDNLWRAVAGPGV